MSAHNGLIAIVKQDCPTCTLVEPVLQQIGKRDYSLIVYTQDNPEFPSGLETVIDDTTLEQSRDNARNNPGTIASCTHARSFVSPRTYTKARTTRTKT